MGTGVDRIIQLRGGDAPAKNQTGVQKIIELLGGDPPAKNQTGVDKIVEILENGGGGGNPNRVETFLGTLDDLTQSITLEESDVDAFLQGICTGQASADIVLDVTAIAGFQYEIHCAILGRTDVNGYHIGLIQMLDPKDGIETAIGVSGIIYKASKVVDGEIVWFLNATSMEVMMNGSILSIQEYVELIPTTLTIVWHPLPT